MVFIFNFAELLLNKNKTLITTKLSVNYLVKSINNFTKKIKGNISRAQRYINKYNLEIFELLSPRIIPRIILTQTKMNITPIPMYIKTAGGTCLTNVRQATNGSMNKPSVLQNKKIIIM